MSIKVRYFASLKESLGRDQDELEFIGLTSVLDVWNKSNHNKKIPDNILAAINMEYVELSHPVNNGDEVAFFPPVTGG